MYDDVITEDSIPRISLANISPRLMVSIWKSKPLENPTRMEPKMNIIKCSEKDRVSQPMTHKISEFIKELLYPSRGMMYMLTKAPTTIEKMFVAAER